MAKSPENIAKELAHLAVPLTELTLDPKNARRHREPSLIAIEESLRAYGQKKPVIALPDGMVIAGNGMLQAAFRLGWKNLAVVRVPDTESEKEWRGYALADNRTAELSSWDRTALVEALKEIKDLPEGLRFGDIAPSAFMLGGTDGKGGGKLRPGMEGWEEKAPWQVIMNQEQNARLKLGLARAAREGSNSPETSVVRMCEWWKKQQKVGDLE